MSDSGGLDFNFTFAPGVSLEQMIGFEMAGEFWSQQLADNATINIVVEMTDYLPENVIGGALPGIEENVRYEEFRYRLEQDMTSNVDSLINENQQDETDKFTAYFSSQYSEDGYKVDNNEYMQMTRANAKALDIIDPHDSGFDSYILIRNLDGIDDGALNDFRWNYDYSDNPIAGNELDFLSVAIHEIGHSLGFFTGVDQANWLAEQADLTEDNEDDYYSGLVGNLNNATPLDMLRFSQASYEASGDGENWIDMSIGGNPYMSFTGSGGTPVAYFSTGLNRDLGGDGYQASHWKRADNPLGIMGPVLASGQRREINQLDIDAFDAIGWDRNTENTDADIETILTEAKTVLAKDIIATAKEEGIRVRKGALRKWVNGNDRKFRYASKIASILTPEFVDEDLNELDDRVEKLGEMFASSGEAYEWGWAPGNVGANSFWWGWARGNVGANSFWWGWARGNVGANSFWWSWQPVELTTNSKE